MGRKIKISKTGALLIVMSIMCAGLISWAVYDYMNPASTQDIDDTTSTFVITVQDMNAKQTLTNSRFDYSLYGLPIGDPSTDPLAWKLIETGTSLDNIRVADLDTSVYSAFYVKYNGTELQATYEDLKGTRTFPVRQQALHANAANELEAYAQPAGISLDVKHLINGTAITNTTATPILAQSNISIIIGEYANFSASYKSYWSYSSNAMVRPAIVMNHNDTVTTSTAIQISGTTMTRVNATAFLYGFSSITDVQSHIGLWPAAATLGSLQVDSCYIDWDGTNLAQLLK